MKNTWEVLTCGAGEGWRISVWLFIVTMEKYDKGSRKKGTSNVQ
jgi:hypothetical protein